MPIINRKVIDMIDKTSPVPMYYQLKEMLENLIKSGELKPGDRIYSENELCEMYDINPYKLESDGALLIAADDADTLINLLEKEGIKAAVIGRATDNNDKVINNLDEVRYLDTPQRDEIYRFL